MKMLKLVLFPLLVISIVSLACNFGLRSITPSTPVVSTPTKPPLGEDGLGVEFWESENGWVKLILDEAQITDIIDSSLQDIEGITIHDVEVFLREGQVQVYGSIQYKGINSNSRIFLVPQIDVQGQPRFVIVSAYYSLFPIPDDMITSLQVSIDQIFYNFLAPLTNEVFVDSISMADGFMVISGYEK